MKYGKLVCRRFIVRASSRITVSDISLTRPGRTGWPSGRGDRQKTGYRGERTVIPPNAVAACWPRHGAAERPADDLCSGLRRDAAFNGISD